MAFRAGLVVQRLVALEELLAQAPGSEPIERWRAGSAALRFHLRARGNEPLTVVVLGGTGTGKSTIVNRLVGADVSAASVRRTFTAGAIAVAGSRESVPKDFLGLPVRQAAERPARGSADELVVVEHASEVTRAVTLVDTPDLDGDQPAHHAQADRAFRWAQGLVFVVTPEKYQMTELLPYYRLANRYALPAVFVMNKAEEQAVVEDYARQLMGHGVESARVFALARDDSAYQAGEAQQLSSAAVANFAPAEGEARERGLVNRTADLLDRLHDQVLGPMEQERREADRLIAALRAMEAPTPEVDVNPLTRQLTRRLQQRSILYLMGPQRILDRVRQVPSLLVRLPRTAWDLVMTGKADLSALSEAGADARRVPDFHAALVDQFGILQTRIEDVIRSSALRSRESEAPAEPNVPLTLALPEYRESKKNSSAGASPSQWKMDTARAGAIADEELGELKEWLEKRWNATPRDTAILMKIVRHLPGGEKLTQWSEAAPYLLAIIVATHHAFFGHVDLMILGGYSLATWLTERMSNEVASRTRLTNRRIAQRFEKLAHEQIRVACAWIDARAASRASLEKLRKLTEEMGLS